MLEQDYLVRILTALAAAIRRSMERTSEQNDPEDAARLLDVAVGEAVDFDSATFLSLSPDSIAGILQVSGTHPQVMEYVTRSLALAGDYYAQAGEQALADLRLQQARALADAYDIELGSGDDTEEHAPDEAMSQFLNSLCT